MKLRYLYVLFALLAVVAVSFNNCSGFAPGGSADNGSNHSFFDPSTATVSQVLSGFPSGEEQRKIICARSGKDKFRSAICAPDFDLSTIRSLRDLQKIAGLSFQQAPLPNFAFTGNSTSLVTREVSSINPRAVLFSAPTLDFVTMGFTRGEPFVEVIAGDPSSSTPAFFLVKYTRACDARGTCNNADTLSAATEKNWTSVSIYEDTDIKNTILDCRQCHQPNGPTTPKFLRMQELVTPWTHWFANNLDGGKALLADFHAAHGTNEDYAGIPADAIDQSNPAALEVMITLLGQRALQTNTFDSLKINAEAGVFSGIPSAVPGAFPSPQPAKNPAPVVSTTWEAIYEEFVAGNAIMVPYHDLRVSDATKLAAMTKAYNDLTSGALGAGDFPDIREVYPDDPKLLADMGFRAKPNLPAEQLLTNACAQCHNSNLDQGQSRARFNVNLSGLSSAEKIEAIRRINLPKDHLQHMPPERFRSLTHDETQLLTNFLSK